MGSFFESINMEQIDGSEYKTVSWKTQTSTRSMQGKPFLLNHVTLSQVAACLASEKVNRT